MWYQSHEERHNAIRGLRIECAGCSMFGDGDHMTEHRGKRYHPDCLHRFEKGRRAAVLELVHPKEDAGVMPERQAA